MKGIEGVSLNELVLECLCLRDREPKKTLGFYIGRSPELRLLRRGIISGLTTETKVIERRPETTFAIRKYLLLQHAFPYIKRAFFARSTSPLFLPNCFEPCIARG